MDDEAESDRDQSLYQVTTEVAAPEGQSTEEMLEARMRKAPVEAIVEVAHADTPQAHATEDAQPEVVQELPPTLAARDDHVLDALRRKVLGMWCRLSADKQANVAKNVEGLDIAIATDALADTTDIALLTAVLETIPGA